MQSLSFQYELLSSSASSPSPFHLYMCLGNKAEQRREVILMEEEMRVSSVQTEITKGRDNQGLQKHEIHGEIEYRITLLFFFIVSIRKYPIYSSGRKFKINKGSHFSHIIETHAKLNCETHYHGMLWRSEVQKVQKGIKMHYCGEQIHQRLLNMIAQDETCSMGKLTSTDRYKLFPGK